MSGETKVKLILITLFIGLVLANLVQEPKPSEPIAYETVLVTEKREIISDEDIVQINSGLVNPILYSKIGKLPALPPFEEKNRFINIILPAILVAKYEINQDLIRLNDLLAAENWSSSDSVFLRDISKLYKTDKVELLQERLLTHPNSIVLAQAAVESGWGSSRFFKRANNLFGVWSFDPKEPRIPASVARPDFQVYLRKYNDISESIKDYFKTIARHRGYQAFVEKRKSSNDVQELVPLLRSYSERGEAYTRQILSMIRFNEFEQYDSYTIDPKYLEARAIVK
ncbi:glucosaminidase domain-containing protein [Roseivirga sp.]|uniref:glucosaminidase domain-containing protein n=1 Tax=Roseivirga sp. TaxID=1964215 RepID=UPI003B8E7046